MSLLDFTIKMTNEYIEKMPKSLRKKYGQFFTSKETAIFMAELFDIPQNKEELHILDAGAGTGILSIALIDRLQNMSYFQKIHLVCYENDSNVIELLKDNLDYVCQKAKIQITYELHTENYIISQMLEYNEMLGANANPLKYDMVIGNPPYMKIAKDAPEATAMPDVCYGAPNLYFLFASMGMFNLAPSGEMVYIIPRSWTSGTYFKKFRQKFLSEGALEHIHLFVSRDKVFEKENVLQETIIIKVRKTNHVPQKVMITTTQSNCDFSDRTTLEVPYHTVVSGKDSYVYLVTNEQEIEILEQLNSLENTLPSIGLKMKTGLTVDFRNKDLLRDTKEPRTVPLFYSQHIQDGRVSFPIEKEHEYILAEQTGLLQKNVNYLFIKRFTSKEEHRRLQCGVYLAKHYSEYTEISTQNKINFIDGLSNLSECIVYGLYVLFNSTLYDCYYRILNGSTQVNSTEINSMPVPSVDTIEAMGQVLIQARDMSETICDRILRSFIDEQNDRYQDDIERIGNATKTAS
ncbi:Eco57I restriction-modification methylase domain-containing protein [Parasphaerochaeta coccoides]|uniref:site-specific DNA-methyltransferase (adenine-specific) n=1 Tax=Parasphaerochaeta coccoides (strain ATCC BAA-1237 / DSM 17374 / SPN1) TaxID=760011 RepID=F4GKS1_PARC1|nr:Eco57I restriction-modification methylase domain-containing protein [Parasphaerochaeta coccoides]AEC01480.1 Site-specific DNA-methyltransferase (adenine-specific) [Parasphaerochaeta coccoides DSM 17374]